MEAIITTIPVAVTVSWLCQIYLAFFFLRSAYRKMVGFERVSGEFRDWGYPFPSQVTVFLIIVWVICAPALLVPSWVGLSAVTLLAFMTVAFATLLVHGLCRKLIEPTVPIVLLLIVIAIRRNEVSDLMTG